MRPLELTVEGFKSYRDPVVFSFEDRSLFGIVGPTGAGKSSILEAIVFALYGKAPGRDERGTEKLIHSGTGDATVRLTFEVDSSMWTVTRVIRRRGASQVTLHADGSGLEESGKRAVNAKVEELVGLDFPAFCSSVMLPQGEFDNFLAATPGKRTKILKGIFRLERIDALREAGRARLAEVDTRLAELRGEMEALPADPARLEADRRELAELEERASEIRKVAAEAAEVEQRRASAAADLRGVRRRVEEVSAGLTRIPDTGILEELSEREAQATESVSARSRETEQIYAVLEEAAARAESAEKETGGAGLLAEARHHLRDRDRLTAETKGLGSEGAKLSAEAERAEAEVEEISRRAEGAERAVTEARASLEALRQKHAAHMLRRDLEAGEPCPVCEQEVQRVPSAGRAPGVKGAEEALAKAEAALGKERKALERSRTRHATAAERLKSLAGRLQGLAARAAEVDAALTGLLGEGDPGAEIERREQLLREAGGALQSARSAHEAAGKALAEAEKSLAGIASERRRHAAALIEVCGMLRVPRPEVEADAAALLDAAKRVLDAGSEELAASEKEASDLQRILDSADEVLERMRTGLGLDRGAPITRALEEVQSRIGVLTEAIATVEAAMARAGEIAGEVEVATATKSLYERLSADLTDHRFTAYLLDEERRLLSQLGSEQLFELTGRYRFDDEGRFQIVDARTGIERTSDTLSGGETFLASLALALALGEAVSREGGRLACFFLDEGFGALDQESLEIALDGIERLGAPGRLIGLISHVGGIQARLDDLIVLDKNEDGTTNVVQTDGPVSYPSGTI